MKKDIPLSLPQVGLSESWASFRAVSSGWLTQFGREVTRMEENINSVFSGNGEQQTLTTTTSNGTTALHLALLSLGISTGDEVIIPNFCYVAIPNAVLYCGATPVVVDVSKETWNLDLESVLKAVTPKTKVVILVDNYGARTNVERFRKELPSNIRIVHDCAESFPPRNASLEIGGADLITLSCYANKILTAGEGGAVVGKELPISRIRILKNQAQNPKQKFSHSELGFNYRLTNVQAAIFNAQWRKRNKIIEKRLRIFDWYIAELKKSSIKWTTNFIDDSTPWLFTISLDIPQVDTTTIIEILKAEGVETRPGFTPIGNLDYLQNRIRISGNLTNSIDLSKSIVSLPTYPALSRKKIKRIIKTLEMAIELSVKN